MSISRRNAITGAAAVAAIPVTVQASNAQAADPVVGLSRELRAADRAWTDAINTYEQVAHSAGLSVIYGEGLVKVETPDGLCIWGASEIRQAAEDGRHSHRLTPKQRDAALAKLEWLKNDAHKRRRELGIEPLYQEREHWKARYRDLKARLLDTPATTPGGVLAKMHGFYEDEEIAMIRAGDDPDNDLPGDYIMSIYRDLERLAEGLPS